MTSAAAPGTGIASPSSASDVGAPGDACSSPDAYASGDARSSGNAGTTAIARASADTRSSGKAGTPGDAHASGDVAEVAVTLPVPGRYHYLVPGPLAARARVGARVLVRFGGQKVTGVVVPSATRPPIGVKLLPLSDVLDDEPALSPELVELCLWVAEYYEAPPGEVMRAALPAGTGVAAKRMWSLTEAGERAVSGEGTALPAKQQAMLAQLVDGPLPATGLAEAIKKTLVALRERGLVVEGEKRAGRVKLKRERIVSLAPDLDGVNRAAPSAVRGVDGAAGDAARGVSGDTALVDAVRGVVTGGEAVVDASGVDASGVDASGVDAGRGAVGGGAASGGGDASDSGGGAERSAKLAAARAKLAAARAKLERAPKQRAAFDALVAAGGTLSVAELSKVAGGVVPALVKAGLVVVGEREVTLEAAAVGEGMHTSAPPELMPEQATAVAVIGEAMTAATRKPFLLHGVTGSGKTEVYLRVIAQTLAAGKTALVLVPEISLTPQLAARFRARFGDQVAILHSGLSEQARLGEWSRLRRGEATIAVGARSAVFAPLTNVGVIVVDEEHDGSFKQDEGVRYHARDVALVRAQRAGAVAVLGSATPSLETFAHAQRGNYVYLQLTQRPTARPMPTVDVVDLRVHLADGDAFLSSPLRTAIGETLANGDQTILFLNRRGFATFVLCKACGHAFRCPHCSVSLTYHRHSDRLSCHYCGFAQRVPEACPMCGGKDSIIRKGLGTEKVADAVAAEFPQARVARLDRDVASGAKIEAVLARVARREVDVLVGTQMVTKGHDFPGVTLVGVLCADTGLNIPDFRASERTFQLLAQVAGRAGRGDRPGRVVVQTYRPTAAAVTCAAAHDYQSFFAAESASREELLYPPHGRLIAVRIDGPDASEVAALANKLAALAETVAKRPENGASVEIRGPVPAPLEKLRNRTRWQIWLRGTDRAALRRVARALTTIEVPSRVRVGLDVDPISAL